MFDSYLVKNIYIPSWNSPYTELYTCTTPTTTTCTPKLLLLLLCTPTFLLLHLSENVFVELALSLEVIVAAVQGTRGIHAAARVPPWFNWFGCLMTTMMMIK